MYGQQDPYGNNPGYNQGGAPQYGNGAPPQQYGNQYGQPYYGQPQGPPMQGGGGYGGQQAPPQNYYGQPQQGPPPSYGQQPQGGYAPQQQQGPPPGYGQQQAQYHHSSPQPQYTSGPEQYTQQPPQQQVVQETYGQKPQPSPQPQYAAVSTSNPDGWEYGYNEANEKRLDYDKSQYRDLIWAGVFVAHLLGMAAALVIELGRLKSGQTSGATTGLGVYIACGVAGGIIGYLWLKIMQAYAGCVIKFMLIFTAVMFGITVLFMFLQSVFLGILFGIFFVFYLFYIWAVQSRIPFATAMLNIAARIIESYPATIWVALGFMVLQIVWVIWWGLVASANAVGGVSFITFLFFISLYWTLEVLKTTVHVTVAGVAATWYFTSTPKNPTQQSLKRATTTSFGSVCLGSLIVAIIQALRALVRAARSENDNIIMCLVECLIHCIEDMLQYFNVYAYAQVAIYGKTYIEAAKDTWQLFLSKGLDALINDDLTGLVVTAGALIAGLLCGILGAVIALNTSSLRNAWVMYAIGGLFIGFFLCGIVLNVVRSAIATIFVCWAEDPAALAHNRPQENQKLTDAWNAMR